MTPIRLFHLLIFASVFVFGCLFGAAALHDYLVYRDLKRRLREERAR